MSLSTSNHSSLETSRGCSSKSSKLLLEKKQRIPSRKVKPSSSIRFLNDFNFNNFKNSTLSVFNFYPLVICNFTFLFWSFGAFIWSTGTSIYCANSYLFNQSCFVWRRLKYTEISQSWSLISSRLIQDVFSHYLHKFQSYTFSNIVLRD